MLGGSDGAAPKPPDEFHLAMTNETTPSRTTRDIILPSRLENETFITIPTFSFEYLYQS